MTHPPLSGRNHGNTLSEYAFILSLISLAAVGALNLLGPSIAQLLSAPTEQNGGPSMRTYVATVLPGTPVGNTPVNPNTPPQPNGNPPADDNRNETNSNPLQLNTSSTSGTNSTSVDGLGMVKENAQTLKSLAQELQADPNTDPGLRDLVTRLANTGHEASNYMAGGIKVYEMSLDDFRNGAKLTLTSSSIRNTITSGAEFNSQSQALAAYLQKNPNALSQAQQQTIQAASSEINGVLGQLGDPTATDGNKMVDAYTQNWVQMAENAQSVRNDANTICRTGGRTHQCVR